MSELEEENNSNKEINKSVETENTFHKQHICDLEYKKEIQEAEIKNLKLTLQETLNREIELDTFIEKQHVTISALEEQDEHIKKTNENLENENAANKQQLFDLEKTCSEQTQTISANEITLQDQMVEIEALRSSMESQQFAIKEVKEQLIKNQMLMDAKECQLIEMEEQLKKETQRHLSELEDVSGVHDSFEKSLDESSKENSELKTFLHSKQLLISELEEQLADRQLLIESKEKQLDEMNQQSAKQKEKYELELKQLSTDKSKEITAIYNELEGKLKEKDLVEDLVKKQESSIAQLKEQMSDYDTMHANKEKKMLENEEQLKQDIEKLVSNLETVSSANTRALEDSALEKGMLEEEVSKHEREIEKLQEEVKQCKLVVDEKYLELEAMDQKLVEEKEKSAHDLENMTLEKDKEVYKMQLRIDEIKTEKSCLEDVVSKQQSDMNELQERLKGKQTEIDEWDEKLTKQKEKHALDLKKLSGDKGKEITAIFNELEEKLKEKDLLEDLVKKQETSILKLKEQLNKYNELNDNKDVRMGEREDQLKKEIENLQADLKEMDNRLERTKLLENTILAKERDIGKLEEDLRRSQVTLDKKQTQFAEVQDQLITYKEKMALDLEILTSTKNEELTNTQQCLDELSSQKEELEGLVELKQAYIIELEEQLKESNNMVDTKQSLLADMEDQLVKAEEDHASDLENSTNKADELNSSIQSVLEDSSKERESLKDVIKQRDADVERLETQLKEHKEEIDEKHTQLIALEQKLVDALKKHSIDIARLSTEKTEQIVAIQNELNTRITEKEQLACENEMHKDTIVKLKGRSGEVERQHEEEKAKLQVDTQFVLDENLKEKDHLEDLISQQQTTIDELGEQLKESKLLVDEWKNQSFAVKEQLTQEKEEHVLLIQEISDDQKEKEKEHLIAVEEISKEKYQMEDVLKKQQVYIGELEEQLIKSKDFLEEKQTQLNKIEEEFLKEKQRIAVDFEKISNQTENSLHEQIKENNELNDSITNQKTIASNLEEEVSEQKAKCETQQTKITELEEMVADKQAVIGEKDAVIGEKDVVIGQKDVVIGEKDAELKELKSKKGDCLSEIGNLIAEKKQAVTTIQKKDETISTMQDAISNMENTMSTLENTIQENSKERGTLEMSIINQQSLMAQLEEELSKHRVLVECKETEFGKVELVKKEKEEQVSKLLNESAEMKEILETLQQCLDEKVQQGAALSEMMENEKSLNADLEKQVNEKSEEVTALKQQVEKENISHLADLEQISLVKDEMIETIQSTLKEQMAEKCEFQNVIDNQLAVIVGLEEQLSAQKKLNDEKFGMLETREQLLKTKDKRILDLQKEIEEDAKKISNVQETMQKQIEEGEKKRNVLDESLQQKLIKEAELNEHIITLQTQIEHVEKKVNEQETLLAEKNNQLNVSQEEIERISLGKEADIANIQGELQAHSNESSHLKTIVEKQQMQIADMENEFETQRSQSERMIMELTDETKELKEKSDILEKTIEQKVIQEADCDDLIQKQKTLISELEKQVEELQHLFSAANEELQMVKQQMGDEKEQYTTETQKFSSEKQQEVEGLQHELEEKSSENEQMRRQILTQKNSFQANNQHFVESEAQLKKECEEVKKKLAKCEKTIQEKLQEAEDQQELLKIQKSFIAQSEKKVQEYQTSLKAKIDELADAKQLLSKERNQHMLDFENVSSKQKETISNMEKVLEEEINEKKELKAYIESQEALAEELKKQLNEHKIQIASKENMLADMRSHHAKALEKRNIDFEQAASEKMESISCMERKLEEEVRKKDELADFLKNQQLHIDDLENEVSGNKMAMCEQEEQLNGNKEMLAALEEQLNENKVTMAQQDHQLMEIKGEHAKTLEKHECDFNNATIEHRREMSVLEKNVSDQVKECDELRDIVKRQQALVCELDEQLNQQKTSVLIKEKELSELKECLAEKNDIASKISELKKEVADKQTKITSMENNLQERSRELQDANDAMMKQQIKQTELEEQLNEHNVMLHAKNHEFIETKETLFKESAQQCEKWEWEKEVLQNNLKKVEEKVKKVEEDLSKKTDELCALQKAHNEVKLQHINEMMKLNNDHRSQVATLMEIPQKDRNIKVLLMDLQKEADEVLNLVLHHDDINEDTPPERIETLKATWNQEKEMLLSIIDDMRKNAKESTITEMSAVSAHNLSSEDVSEIANEPATLNSESSLTSLPSDKRTDMEQSKGRNKSHHVNKSFDKQNNQQKQRQDAILHENSSGIVSEFEKLLNDESAKVEGLNAKLEEQMRLKESMQMSHEVELAKVVERELNLKEKYLKVAELLQKEKNAKTRIMEMLNDAQRLNDIQGQNLEEVQNDKNSLLESYNIVSELEHLLSKEKEKADLANTKLEKEKYEKLSIQASFEDKRAELKATKERESTLREKCRELNGLLEKENEDKRTIADTLENERKMIVMEKKNLEQKESSLNQTLAKLVDNNVDERFKSLKSWEDELKKREKTLLTKDEKLKSLMKGIEQGYDILPERQGKDSMPEKSEKSDDSDNDWLKQIQSNQLVDRKHLPLVADLNQKIKSLQKDKVKLAETLTDLKNEIIDYRKQLKDYQLLDEDNRKKLEDKESRLTEMASTLQQPHDAVQQDGKTQTFTSDGQKLLNAGWTIAKVQRLYLKYFRAESFRKALVYQKRYLTLMVNENDQQSNIGNAIAWPKVAKRKVSFKVAVLAVISIRRMKYLVKKYHRNLHKSSPDYQYKDKPRNAKKKNSEHAIDEFDASPITNKVGIADNQSTTTYKAEMPEQQFPSTTRSNSTRQPQHTASILPQKTNPRHSYYSPPKHTQYTPATNEFNRLNTSEPINRLNINNELINNTVDILPNNHHVSIHDASTVMWPNEAAPRSDNMWSNEAAPRSYPRPSGLNNAEDISPSRGLARVHGELNSSRVSDKGSLTNRVFEPVSPPSPLLSSTTRDVHEPDANESLSSYIHTLETLQNRLKKVGYNDRARPSLL